MVNSHEYYMKFALREAEAARDRNEIPVGAVVVCNGRIIARAHNLTETLTDVTSQVGAVVYGASDDKRGFRKFAPEALHPKTVVTGGVMKEECAALMKEFFKKKR